jgi:ribosomal protein S17E
MNIKILGTFSWKYFGHKFEGFKKVYDKKANQNSKKLKN